MEIFISEWYSARLLGELREVTRKALRIAELEDAIPDIILDDEVTLVVSFGRNGDAGVTMKMERDMFLSADFFLVVVTSVDEFAAILFSEYVIRPEHDEDT